MEIQSRPTYRTWGEAKMFVITSVVFNICRDDDGGSNGRYRRRSSSWW